jgi:hypothetical protein|tara:strand:- start:5120 stop:5254 length:135 start_codon:yes stop_codon:yes gene_type:complete
MSNHLLTSPTKTKDEKRLSELFKGKIKKQQMAIAAYLNAKEDKE